MLTMSKPLSASQARMYHAKEFASQQQNYWSRDQQGHSEWQGRLARQWNLDGPVHDEHFARLAEGQHPQTGEQLVRHQVSRTYEGKNGKEDHQRRAPRRVGCHVLRAEVGFDYRAWWAAMTAYAWPTGRACARRWQSWSDTRRPASAMFTRRKQQAKFAAATFEHDTARPVDGYAAPQLHTHAVIFNVTERDNGQTRALQPHEIFVSQRYVTAVYRSELALRLEKLGYEIGTRQAWTAGNQGIYERVSGGVQPAPGTDQRPSPRARHRWSRQPRRSPRITRATARSCCRRRKSCGGTVNWPRSSGTRQIEWSLRRRAHGQYQMREPEMQRAAGGDLGAGSCLREIGGAGPPRDSRISPGARHGRNHVCQHPAGVRAPDQDRRIPRSCPQWRRPAIHDYGNDAHGARDHCPDAGGQPARLRRSHAGFAAGAHQDRRPAPGTECVPASGRGRAFLFRARRSSAWMASRARGRQQRYP